PPTWTARLAEQGGVRYRYFESSPAGPQRKTVTATLVSATLRATLDDYANQLLEGSTIQESREETRGSAKGRRYRATTPDGTVRHSVLLFQEGQRAFGLQVRGEAAAFAAKLTELEIVERTLAPEPLEDYPENRQPDWGFAVRLPSSWTAGRTIAGHDTYLTQFLSPPLAIDQGGQTARASLTLTVEKAPGDGSVDAFRTSA